MSVWSVLKVLQRRDASFRLRMMAATNIVGFLYFILITFAVTYLSLYRAVPLVINKHKAEVHYYCIYFLFIQVVGNFYQTCRVETSIRTLGDKLRNIGAKRKSDEAVDKKEMDEKAHMSYCKKCKAFPPLRCHHCVLCNVCILKRDHHCFFMCVCVGYHNQKHFIIFCFYMFISGLYGAILLAMYLNKAYGVIFSSPLTLITLLPNSLAEWYLRGGGDPHLMTVVGIFYGSFLGGMAAAGFLFWQMGISSLGQTTHEARCGDESFNVSLSTNFKDTFGPYWYLSLIAPLRLKQHGDGTYTLPDVKKSTSRTLKRKGINLKGKNH